jgi:hypothetical protein
MFNVIFFHSIFIYYLFEDKLMVLKHIHHYEILAQMENRLKLYRKKGHRV